MGRSPWYTYEDLGVTAITVEDFYKKEFFIKVTEAVLKKYDVNISTETLPTDGRIDFIKSSLNKDQRGLLIQKSKEKNMELNKLIKEMVDEIKSQCYRVF